MAWYDRKKKKQKDQAVPADRYDTCSFCKGTFNWRIAGVTNGLKEVFCSDECLRENYLKNVRELGETVPFDAL